jgi:hypothetical protein
VRERERNIERERHTGTIAMMTSSWPLVHTSRHRHCHRRLCTHRQIASGHTAYAYTGTHRYTHMHLETHIQTGTEGERGGRVYVCMGLGAYPSVVSRGRRGSMKVSSARAPSLPMLLLFRLCQGGQAPKSAARDSRYSRSHTDRDRERKRIEAHRTSLYA